MATIDSLLHALSNFYDLVSSEDRLATRALWQGYALAINDLYVRAYQVDLAKGIASIKPTVRREWWTIDITYAQALAGVTTFQIDAELTAIPSLQEGVSIAGTVMVAGTDYLIDDFLHTITFITNAARAVVGKTISLTDPNGVRTAAGIFVDGAGLSGLVIDIDYKLPDPNTLLLLSKVAMDTLAATGDPAVTAALQIGRLFAPSVETDENLVYRNFGRLVGLSPSQIAGGREAYLQAVRGMWYIAWNGPTPRNLAAGVSLLMGFAVAPFDGTITDIQQSGSDYTVSFIDAEQETQSVTFGDPFLPIVTIGQVVRNLDPLSDALKILEESSSPGWWVDRIGLEPYADPETDTSQITAIRGQQIKSLIKNNVFGLLLKDFQSVTDLQARNDALSAASRFLKRIKPLYTQFSFLGDLPIVDTPELFTLVDVDENISGFASTIRTVHQTILDNFVSQLRDPDHYTGIFADYNAYYASSADPQVTGNIAYYLGDDDPATTDIISFMISFTGSGGYVSETNPTYTTFRTTKLADTQPPIVSVTPQAGVYFAETSIRIRTNKPSTVIYTLDGTAPAFSPQNGKIVTGKIIMPNGLNTLKILAKDSLGNTTSILTFIFTIFASLPATVVNPTPEVGVRTKGSAQVTFGCQDPNADVFYTTDGRAPTDFAFQDLDLLNGIKVVWAAPTAIQIEDTGLSVYFGAGTTSQNTEGARTYAIETRPSTRYFVYLKWLGPNQWGVSFANNNTTFQPNTSTRLLVAFVCTDAAGQIQPDSISNAVDSGAVNVVTKDSGLPAARMFGRVTMLNFLHPVPVPSTNNEGFLRFFVTTPSGQVDGPRTVHYTFDTVAPRTTLIPTLQTTPYPLTQKIILVDDTPGAVIFYSLATSAPVPIIFGFPDKLVNGLNLLTIDNPSPNLIAPHFSTFTITFKIALADGSVTSVVTTADLNSGGTFAIPIVPNSFFDISVVPDFDDTSFWRLEVGEPNISVIENTARFLVARCYTDIFGVLDLVAPAGSIAQAVESPSSPSVQKTNKYVEPFYLNVTIHPFSYTVAFFSVDPAGNVEAVQTQVFAG